MTPWPKGLKSSTSPSWLKLLEVSLILLPHIRFNDEFVPVELEIGAFKGGDENPRPRTLKRG